MLVDIAERAQLVATLMHDPREGRDHAAHPHRLAGGRKRNLEALLVARFGQRIELHFQPGAVFRAHVHRQRLGDRSQAARLLGTVDPDLERHRGVSDLPDEDRE